MEITKCNPDRPQYVLHQLTCIALQRQVYLVFHTPKAQTRRLPTNPILLIIYGANADRIEPPHYDLLVVKTMGRGIYMIAVPKPPMAKNGPGN